MSLQKKKKKKKAIIDKTVLSLEPINVFVPLSMSQENSPSPSLDSVPKVLAHPIRDSRKSKGVVNDITTNMDEIALYHSLKLK